ncbi:site-2 protease family protein [Specibacter cremeus]|uniref:site-2 protease family protein n=1 Tax=Specibacter cremeus TaxID=1629051 RepID=UPI000F77A750|nr:site-2 protease family protein [Specibacter cremeus]
MTDQPARGGRFREGIPLGHIAGVPIVLAQSWFVIAAFTVIVFGPQLQRIHPDMGIWGYVIAFCYALLLLFSVLVHELAHALSAKMYGWPIHKIVLNLWGGHTEFDGGKSRPGAAVVVAFAGPVANFVLAGIAYLVYLAAPAGTGLAGAVLLLLGNIFIWANLLIGGFNILPGLPLDGGRLVESIVWKATGSQEKGTIAAGWAGRIVTILIVIVGLGWPVWLGGGPDLTTIVVTLFLAGFLWMGASASIANARLRLRLPTVTAGSLAVPAVGAPATCSVAQLWAMRAAHPSAPIILCSAEGRPSAVVDEPSLANVPPAIAGHTPATSVARTLAPGAYVPQQAAGAELVQYLAQLAGSEYAVIDAEGRVTGLLQQAVVVAALQGK